MPFVYCPTLGSIRELWENAEEKISSSGDPFYPQRQILKHHLQELLQWELERGSETKLLQEYREVFDFDTEYSLYVKWEVEPGSYTQSIPVGKTFEEVRREMKKGNCEGKEYEMPEFSSYPVQEELEYGHSFTGEWRYKTSVWVNNLSLKKVPAEV